MKRSDALKLIANQLDFLNGRFKGFRSTFTEPELRNADVILTTLEQAGMQPPLGKEKEVPVVPSPGVVVDVYQTIQKREWDEEVEDPFDGKRNGGGMTIDIKEITKINVKPGDFLYVQLPDDVPTSELPVIFAELKKYFDGQQVKILVGDMDLKFSTITFEETAENGPQS